MEQERKITYSAYPIGKVTAVVCSIYKSENSPDVNNALLRLIQSDIEYKNNQGK